MSARVVMYSSGVCPYCTMAERLLKSKGVDEIEKIRRDRQRQFLFALAIGDLGLMGLHARGPFCRARLSAR